MRVGREWVSSTRVVAIGRRRLCSGAQNVLPMLTCPIPGPSDMATLLPSGKDLCTFNPAYVRCDPGTGVVTHLIFRELGLSGTIPSDLGTLHRNLTVLDLGDNHLAGEIPRSLYSCQQLTGLYLKSNRLTGTLPNQISRLQSLRQLFVGQNRLSGEIPGGIQKLKSIRKLFSLAFSSPSGWGLGLGLGFWAWFWAWRTRDDS